MKSFFEALDVIKNNIYDYQEICRKANHQVLSDEEAFFRNLMPFGKKYGGITGFQRAEKFIISMEEEIAKENINTTEQLIDFAANYFDKGGKLSNYIWKSIRETAGFTEAHVRYLIPIYQDANASGMYDLDLPSKHESQASIEKLINRAICGFYDEELLKYLRSYLGLESNQCADYGKKLLDHLNSKIPQVKLELQRLRSQ